MRLAVVPEIMVRGGVRNTPCGSRQLCLLGPLVAFVALQAGAARGSKNEAVGPPAPAASAPTTRLGTDGLRHAGRVTCVAVSPDGTTLASAGDDTALRLWSTRPLASLRTLDINLVVNSVAFTDDGTRLVAGTLREVVIYDLTRRSPPLRLSNGERTVYRVATLPDGRIAVVARDPIKAQDSMAIWDIPAGAWTADVPDVGSNIARILVSRAASTVMTTDASGGAVCWDMQTVRPLGPLPGWPARPLCVSANGELVAWHAGTEIVVRRVKREEGAAPSFERLWTADLQRWIQAAEFLPDASALVVATSLPEHRGSAITVVRATDGRRLVEAEGQEWPVTAIAVSPDGSAAYCAGHSHSIGAWCARTWKRVWPTGGHTAAIACLAFGPGNELVSADVDGSVRRWDVASGRERVLRPPFPFTVLGAAYLPARSAIVVWRRGDRKGTELVRGLNFWHWLDGRQIPGVVADPHGLGLPSFARLMAADDSGSHLGVVADLGGVDGRDGICVWDTAQGRRAFEGPLPRPDARCLAISPDGRWLAVGARTAHTKEAAPCISVLSASTGEVAAERTFPGRYIGAIAYSPDASRVAVAVREGALHLLGPPPRLDPIITAFGAHNEHTTSLAYSPDGALLLTAGNDGEVAIRNSTTGAVLRTLLAHRSAVVCAAFSADGSRLGTGDAATMILVWDLPAP